MLIMLIMLMLICLMFMLTLVLLMLIIDELCLFLLVMLYNGNNGIVLHQLLIRLALLVVLWRFHIMLQPCIHSGGEVIYLEFLVLLTKFAVHMRLIIVLRLEFLIVVLVMLNEVFRIGLLHLGLVYGDFTGLNYGNFHFLQSAV